MTERGTLRFGAERLSLAGLPGTCRGVLEPAPFPRRGSSAEIAERALAAPLGSPPLASLVRPGQTVAILVSGKDRVTRADVFVPILLRQLREAGVEAKAITIFMATGTHIPFSAADRELIFGPDLPPEIRVVPHDCRAVERMVRLGRSRFGNDIWVSREAYEADVNILTGRITHHYFAGFTAGSKAVLPGVSGLETIQRNHRMVLSGTGDDACHPAVRSGCMDGNPVHEEMVEAAALFRPTFLVNTVVDTEHEISHVFCGDPAAAHEAGCRVVGELFTLMVKTRAPAAIASCGGAPYDCSFMQALKAIFHAAPCVADGGGLLLLARCPEGILPGFLRWDPGLTLPALARSVLDHYDLTGHNTYLLRRTLARIRVVLVSDCAPAQVQQLGLIPAPTLPEGWSALCRAIGDSAPDHFAVPYGNITAVEAAT
jgi:lactate racemase